MALSREETEALKTLGSMILGGAAGAAAARGAAAGAGAARGAAARAGAARGAGGYDGKNFGPGFAARPGGRVWTKEGERNDGDISPTSIGAAEELARQKVSEPIDFDAGIIYIAGQSQNNALLDRSKPENIEAFVRQSQQEHDEALDEFFDNPDIPRDRAARLGVQNEQSLVKWWNDRDPRRPVTPSSSCVKRARIGSNGDIYVVFGSNPNREYQYEGSPDPVQASKILQKLVTAPSIGRAVNSWTGEWGTEHTYLPKS